MVLEMDKVDAKLMRRKFRTDDWAAHHGVIPELLDLRYRYINPITALEAIRDTIDDLYHTEQFFLATDVLENDPEMDVLAGEMMDHLKPLALIWGAWVPPENGKSRGTTFANPDYIHLDNMQDGTYITDRETRFKILNTILQHGIPDYYTVSSMFGITEGTFSNFIYQHELNWCDRRKYARNTRLARTLKTLMSWGYNWKRLANAFNLPPGSLTKHISLLNDDWTPPKRPTDPVADVAHYDERDPEKTDAVTVSSPSVAGD